TGTPTVHDFDGETVESRSSAATRTGCQRSSCGSCWLIAPRLSLRVMSSGRDGARIASAHPREADSRPGLYQRHHSPLRLSSAGDEALCPGEVGMEGELLDIWK